QVPMLLDRVRAARSEFLELADELDSGAAQHPTRVALVRELLRDGGGPLYDPRIPESTLHAFLYSARAAGHGPASGLSSRAPSTRRVALAVSALGAAFIVVLVSVAGAANAGRHSFTERVIAASINADGSQSVDKIQDSLDGPGAGTTATASSSTSYPLTGTD